LWKRHFEVPESSRYDFFSDLAFLGSNVFAIRPDGLVFSLDLRSGEEELVATVVPGTRHLAADSVGRLWTLSEGKPVPLASM
jgi:hypothetical protein